MSGTGAIRREVVIFDDKEELSRDAAHRFVFLAMQKRQAGEIFSVALAGGSTPEMLYGLLAALPFCDDVDWTKVHFFFGDERAVPPDHADSNYRMANAKLFAPLALPAANIHRMPADIPDLDAAAWAYEEELRAHFALTAAAEMPQFDLILLGMGPDGHTASLFPHKPALKEKTRLVVASEPGLKPFVPRLTLTYPVLNHAANVLFLVAGADKAATLHRVLTGPADPEALPSQAVAPTEGSLVWLVDRTAMGQ
ncbi:MAG: pgl [Chthonomonadaceae bacterium]|nr:pgl [Chthonomonadaceae bacterium]